VENCLKVFGEPGVVFVDGSWFLKDRNGRKEFEAGPRILGARFFDIDDVAAKGEVLNPKGLPHMMPPKELFAASMDAMEIHNQDHLILYATKGCVSTVNCSLVGGYWSGVLFAHCIHVPSKDVRPPSFVYNTSNGTREGSGPSHGRVPRRMGNAGG
jgi:hypothetical protein